uniref:Large ribosomal subunit protein uL14m n=1 Tax=Acartia pacifica TaxID=335913 RepID=A0A0U2V804_ACAPC|nr:mitochondrial 39S ribosomal protein L14 [Acartia pacifica]
MNSSLLQGMRNLLQAPARSFSVSSAVTNSINNGFGKFWRIEGLNSPNSVWPNYLPHLTHRKHRRSICPHTWGVQKVSQMKIVDNSNLGRQATALERPAYIIQVYSKKHRGKPHDAYGKLGDKVLLAVCGQKKKGIIVGLKAKQLHGVPRFDSNNVVLIEENGNPTGTRITAPIPNVVRTHLKSISNPKKADFTKLLAITSTWV